ncbi:MAG TPA: ribosome small subunit-dependent GTPase A [Candidatus Kapabacteria bacterium]|nr:ribosome small subunit-dependent GTPase A [Candidatus Kapabacteria bacterium]
MTPKYDSEESQGTERIRRAHSDRKRKKQMLHRERYSATTPTSPSKGGAFEEISKVGIAAKILRTEGASFIAETKLGEEQRVRSIKSTVTSNPNSTLVAVGDDVIIEPGDADIGVIREVKPRRTKLSRRAHTRRTSFEQIIAANIDLVAIVTSAADPPFRTGIIDKYIVAALEGGLEILIILNKSDELEQNDRAAFIEYALEYYQVIGYPHLVTAATNNVGIAELRDAIANKTIVFAGKSGVGKSSLVNALVGEEITRTQGLMRHAKRGMHTTTNAWMIPLADHTYIVDTPGVKEFFHFELEPDQIRFLFTEFDHLRDKCQMTNCLHIHEPGCAVIEAVEEELIPEWRYNSYLAFWEEAERERKSRIGGM